MRYVCSAAAVGIALLMFAPSRGFGQPGSGLSVVNYSLVGEERFTRTQWFVTYRADIMNTGVARSGVTASASSVSPAAQVVAGQGILHFAPVPANSRVTSIDTFTLLVDRSVPFDFANIVWSFVNPFANAGPNQTAHMGNTVILNGSGSADPGGGALTYHWVMETRPAASHAAVTGATSVTASFVVDAPGTYTFSLTVGNGAGSDKAITTVTTVNSPPVANAGPNQSVPVNATVYLNGAGSSDVDGDSLTYTWTLISRPAGSAAILSNLRSVAPWFLADQRGAYIVQLVVNDGHGDSVPATVTINTGNTPPVAKAGLPQTVDPGALVQLHGDGSTDVDGDPLTYRWSLATRPAGSAATLNNPAAVNPTFTADLAGSYVAQLIVNDGKVDSAPATVSITVNGYQAPTANAGQNQTVVHGAIVNLNGSGTDPQSLPLTYLWSLITRPDGSAAAISNTHIQAPTFIADRPGTYVAQLVVSNQYLSSVPATVTITTTNTAPVANAGSNRNVNTNAAVLLDGTGSFDADHDPLTYSWSFNSRPQSSSATLLGALTSTPSFVPDAAGTYVLQLIVNDGFVNSNPATVTITASISALGITLSPNPLNLLSNSPGTLTVTLSAPAGAGGAEVSFSGFNAGVISVPSKVVVPENSTGANVTVTPVAAGNTTITAQATGYQNASAAVNVTAPVIAMTLDQTSVGIGRAIGGTLTLSAPAPSAIQVALSVTPPGLVSFNPSSVSIPAGQTSGSFQVTGVVAGSAAIAAASPGYVSGGGNLTVTLLGAISLPANLSVEAGNSVALDVRLAQPAPADGVTVSLSSGDTSVLTVSPGSVFILQGATAPATPPQVTGVALGSAAVTASATGFTGDSKSVRVTGSLSFSVQAVTVGAGGVQSINILLSAPAPAGGLLVNLSSSNTAVATVPASITIPAGATSASLDVSGVAPGSALIRATAPNATDGTANVTVTASIDILMPASISVGPGDSTNLSISLAKTYPVTVSLDLASSDPTKATVSPASVAVPAGQTLPATQVAISGVATGSATITAHVRGVTMNPASTVVNVGYKLQLSPPDVTIAGAGSTANLALMLSAPAPAAGIHFTLSSSKPSVVTVGPDAFMSGTSSSIAVRLTGVSAGTAVIHVSAPDVPEATANVTVQANGTMTVTGPASISLGQSGNLAITLSAPAPTGGVTVALTSSDSAKLGLSTASVTILEGATSPAVAPQVIAVNVGSATITASASGYPAPAPVLVQVGATVTWVTQDVVIQGIGAQALLTLRLSAAAPIDGLTVNLTSSNSAVAPIQVTGLFIWDGSSAPGIVIPITSAGLGTATIHASGANIPDATTTVTVVGPLTITTASLPSGYVNNPYSASLSASGGKTPYAWTATGLPDGLSLNSTSGAITGNATAAGTYTVNATVTDASTPTAGSANRQYTVVISAGVSITTASLPAGSAGNPYSTAVEATGGTTPYTWSATGLPSWLALNASTGVLSGTAQTGSFPFTVTATDATTPAHLSASRQFTVIVIADLAITTASLPSRPAGSAYSAPLAAIGGTLPYTWSATGLPTGFAIDPNTGTISGSPAAESSSAVMVTITDSASPTHRTASKQFTLIITPALSITTAALPGAPVGSAYSATVAATGGTTPYTWSATGLPAGLTINSGTGVISGTPTATASSVTVTVTDATSPTHQSVSRQFTFSSLMAVTVTPANLTIQGAGSQGTLLLTLSGPAPAGGITFTVSSSNTNIATVPPSISIGENSTAISFRVWGTAVGSAVITVSAPETNQATSNVTVAPPGTITVTAPASVGLSSTGTLNLSLSTPAPTGGVSVQLTSSDPSKIGVPAAPVFIAAGAISPATPPEISGVNVGSAAITASATGFTTSTPVVVQVTATVSWITQDVVIVGVGQQTLLTLRLSASAPPNWNDGVSVNLSSSNPSVAPIQATGIFIWDGSHSPGIVIRITSASLGTTTIHASGVNIPDATTTVTVVGVLGITTASIPGGTGGMPYSTTVVASGGLSPLSWSAAGLPPGLTVNSTTGVISGTPTYAGDYTPIVTVTDSAAPTHQSVPKQFAVNIKPGLALVTTSLATGFTGVAYSADVIATGGVAPYAWSATGLPAGLTIGSKNNTTGVVSGNPTALSSTPITVTITDSAVPAHQTVSGQVNLVIAPGLTITTASLPAGVATAAYSAAVAAAGGTPSYTWAATGLPTGFSINPGTGLISGTSNTTGSYTVSVTATDSTNPAHLSATKPFPFTVGPALSITTASLPAGGVTGSLYSATVSATGGTTPYAWSATGLPAGLGIDPGTGVISGTPTVAGSFTAIVTVTDATNPTHLSVTAQFPLTIGPGLAITTATIPGGFSGYPYSATVAATGGTTPYAWSAPGLPAGLAINASTGVISGTPTSTYSGTIDVTVTDSTSPTHQTKTRQFTLNIALGLSITTASLPDGIVNVVYAAPLAATGGTPSYTWSATGLPAGLTINTSTGAISGTPTAEGTFTVNLSVVDSTSPSHLTFPKQLTLVVRPEVRITTTSLPDGLARSVYSAPVAATGGTTPYAWSATDLPAGLSIDPATGVISGTPTTAGPYTAHVTVTDSTNPTHRSASAPFPLTIGPALSISASTLDNAFTGYAYSATLTAAGGTPPYTWSATGLPAGFTISGATSTTAVIAGNPTATGAIPIHVNVTDSTSPTHQSDVRDLTLTIAEGLSITTASLPGGIATSVYSAPVAAAGGTPSYTWSATGLPAGLTMNAGTGVISGTPATAGSYSANVTATDSSSPAHLTNSKPFTIVIAPGPSITTAALPAGVAAWAYSATMAATGGTAPYTWSATGLPAGVAMNASTGVISGTPTATGQFTASVTLTDSTSPAHLSVTAPFPLTIKPGLSIAPDVIPAGFTNNPYSVTLTGTGATAPYTWTATGMPAGFTITPGADTTTAVMAGTPTAVGPITIVVTVTDSTTPSHPFVSKSFTLTVASGVSITTTRLADGVATAIYPGDFLQATGGTPPYTWSATGLPAGLLINPNNGVVSGQPTTEGQYTVNVVATDSTTPAHLSAAKQIPITIGPKPSITTAALPNGITGAPYSFTMAATGGTAPLTWSATGMPAGITINTATGVISGTAGAAGSYPLSITASDSTLPVSLSVTAQLTLKIVSVLTVTTSALPVGFTDRAYSATVEAAGGVPPYSWTAPGLPAGFTITPGTDTTKAVIAGTAAATSSSTVNITVSDSATPTHQSTSKPLTLTIALGLSITTASLPNGFSGSPYAASMAATGGTTPYSWSATGLPDGVTINISTGAISGTPATAGPYTIAVTATDATSPTLTATRQYSITMAAGPQITTASLPARPATSPYSASLAASGGTPPYTWSQTGLPAGLSINTSTGEISGTPSADGSSNVTVSITDSTSPTHLTSSRQYTLTIGPKLSITTTGLPAHPANSAYSFTVLAAGGTMPYAFAATGLPATFAINSTTGAITGNPTVASSGTVTVTVTDATTPGGQTASAQFTLSIGQPLALVTASLPSRPAGSAYSAPAMTATGGTTPYIWSATGLPADGNFTIDPATGVITGTATTPGTSTVTVSVTDSTTPTPQVQSKPLALTITPGPSITTAALPQGQKGTHYSFTVQGTGGTTPYTWSMTGQPAGFAINASTGEISGDPTSESAGTVTVTVTDATSPTHLTVQKTFTLTVTATTYIKTATLPNGTTNSLYSATLEAAGGTPPYSWSAPDLPRNLTIGATNGVIGGTPVNQGTTIISFTVTDSSTPVQTFTRGISLTILNPPPVILTTSLPDGTVDVPYSATVEATSGLPPYNWTAVGIPVGLGLNNITGIISGIPTTPGIYTVTVTATDTIGQHMSKEFTVTVSNVLPGGWIVVSSANVGQNLQVPVTITLNPPPSAGVVLTLTSDNPAVVLGSSLVAGSTYTTANISAGTTMVSTYAKATDASGTAKITASILGYRDGTGTVTMSPASFMLSSKNGMGAAYDTYQSVTSPLTVYAARLAGSGVFAETQELRGGYTVSVPLSNTPTGPGAVSPASVSFSGGMKQTDASFVATTPGVSTITVVAPPPFATPSTGASVVVTVKAQGILPCDPNNPTVAIGKNLQARTCVQLTGGALNPVSLTVHSSDASKLKFSTTPNGALSDTLTLTIPKNQKFSPDFYAHALGAEGPVTYTASADTYGSADLTATIAPSGFVIQTPFGMDADFNVSLGAGVPGLYVWTGRLNAAGAVAETQAVAGGLSVQVSVTSGTATVGTISASPITIAAGAVYGYTDFHPLAQGSTTITASSSGWADGSVLATVVPPTVVVSGDVTIGKFLQAEGTFILPVPAPAGGVRVTLKSNSPLLKISMDPLAAGSDTAYIDFTVGQYIASYYMQALGSTGTVTYTASAPGYNSKDGNVILAPSGIVILGPSIVSLTGGDQPLSVFAAQLDSSGTPLFTQALAGGSSVAVTLNSTNRAVGDIPGTVVIQPNTSGGTAVFHPLLAGYTSITVVQPSSDWFTPNMWTGLTISVQ